MRMNGLPLNSAEDMSLPAAEPRPKNGAVFGLLAGATVIISYLFAYCLMNALVSAEVITRWKPGHDPRPKYFFFAFVTVSALFAGIGFVARTMSKRHLSRIDAMETEEAD